MQKVVGSNPISRFFANPLHVRGDFARSRLDLRQRRSYGRRAD